ncbi:MAG: hypothetical protein JW768_01885 [Chitinispirillaceae bacterium]|nr:hypothetical protein [Chitinispirillaceae bacterium]
MSKKTRHKKRKKARPNGADRKEAEAIKKKLFLQSLKKLMEALGIGDLYGAIPPSQKMVLVKSRFRNFRVEVEQGSQVQGRDLRFFKGITDWFLKKNSLPIGPGNQTISLNDYFTTGYTFMSFFQNIDTASFEGADRLKKAAREFKTWMMKEDNPFVLRLAKLIHYLLFSSSRPDRTLYTVRMGSIRICSGSRPIGISVCLYFRSEKPPVRQVTLEEKKRIAYRVGVPDMSGQSIVWVNIPHGLLGSHYSGKHERFDLYIQSHALHRFDERVRGLDSTDSLILSLNYSLKDPAVAEYANGSGLIAFIHAKKKFGYFTFTLIDDMLVIRTFLFLTNSGTPEGKRIDRLLGIRKMDKQYLELDTAYAFTHTDLLNSPWLCDLLVEAGCEQLCDMVAEDTVNDRKPGYALQAARYLGLPETIHAELF